MKAQELRIGNLVKYDNRIFEIDSIAKVFPTLNTDEFGIGVVDYNNIEPILLTEEWLFRFGFDKTYELRKNIYCLKEYKAIIYFYKNSRIDLKIGGYEFKDKDRKQKRYEYVHQLQNLYFALTGEELIHDEWIVTKDNYPSIVDILKD